MLITKENIRTYVHCYLIHQHTKYATEAASIIATQWNHKQDEINRNIKNMLEDSKDNLPCHLALVLQNSSETQCKILNDTEINSDQSIVSKKCCLSLNVGEEVVVGHVKLMKADGRGDGSCCISYSLVVPEKYRVLGLGRLLTEEAENYARSLSMAYMYLSTNDKVSFYEHLGYKQCEPVSSLRNNSKRLTDTQVSSLEGLFAKRLNICNPMNCNTWLRKRLVNESCFIEPDDLDTVHTSLVNSLEQLWYDRVALNSFKRFQGLLIQVPWQQQTGPSCGIALLSMLDKYFDNVKWERRNTAAHDVSFCHCVLKDGSFLPKQSTEEEKGTILEMALQSGVSNDGEIFCAYNLAYLYEKNCNMNLAVKEIDQDTVIEIIESIHKGFPILIAYDRSLHNHTPGFFDGKQAHWAAIIGILYPFIETNSCADDEIQLSLQTVSADNPVINHTEIWSSNNLILVCQHGMSKKLFVCTSEDMIKSNSQLNESKTKFYLASEDLKHLKNKILFVKKW